MEKLEELLPIIAQVAQSYSPDSKEQSALALASKALIFAYGEHARPAFDKFVGGFDDKLSETQIAKLRAMGIDPS